MIEVFTIKLGDMILKPRTKVSSGDKTEMQVLRNHIPCPRILKLICQSKRFNPPVYTVSWKILNYNSVNEKIIIQIDKGSHIEINS